MSSTTQQRDVIVVGASAGGVQALSELLAGLPEDLEASVFLVLHTAATVDSRLPDVLARRTKLPVRHALHGEPVEPGRVYVAPPDNHLMLRPGYLHVARGPKENGHRPAVDALFRSASTAYGPRVIAVVLTGYLDCGTAGLMSVKARGGVAVVQDPRDAEVPNMPQSAIRHVSVDHVAPLRDIPRLVTELSREPAGPGASAARHSLLELEGDEPGAPSEIVCPLCNGSITESELGGFRMFRCHVGHAFSVESMAQEQADTVERALWAAVRALDEGASLSQRLAGGSTGDLRRRFEEKSEAQRTQADVIRRILLNDGQLSAADVPAAKAAQKASGGDP